MQKRYLVIFSLLVVSVLFIAGCQEGVGGRYGSTRSKTDSPFPAYTDSVRVNDNVRVAVPNSFAKDLADYAPETVVATCPGITIGAPVELRDSNDGSLVGCYKVVDCVAGTYNSNPYKSERLYDYSVPIYLPAVKFIETASQFCQGAKRMSTDWVVMVG